MTEDFDSQAPLDLTERLQAYGAHPVDPPVASRHLTAIASVRPVRKARQRLAVAGALVAGTLIGSTGLAVAGALPKGAQDAASAALAKVNVEVPKGTERYDGAECAGDTPARNRGQYLKQERAKGAAALAAAKASRCGMPIGSGDDDAATDDEDGTKPEKNKAEKNKADKNKAEENEAGENEADKNTANKPDKGKADKAAEEAPEAPEVDGADDAGTAPAGTDQAPARADAGDKAGDKANSGDDAADDGGAPATPVSPKSDKGTDGGSSARPR